MMKAESGPLLSPQESPGTDAGSSPTPTIGIVDLNTRYMAACAEINTRVALRQNTMTIFIAILFGICATLTSQNAGFDTKLLVFAVPFASLVFAALYLMHDLMIGNLVSFCRECERFNNTTLPGYLTHPTQQSSIRIRRWHDVTAAVLVVGADFGSGYLIWHFHPQLIRWDCGICWLCLLASVAALVMVLLPSFVRSPDQ